MYIFYILQNTIIMKTDYNRKLEFLEKMLEVSSLTDLHEELENYIDIKKQSFEQK